METSRQQPPSSRSPPAPPEIVGTEEAGELATQRRKQAKWRPWSGMLDVVAASVPSRLGTVAVDVGCGTGDAMPLLRERGWDAIGIDGDDAMLSAARK